MFSFFDTNFMSKPNHPEIKATAKTYNGYQYRLHNETAVAHADLATAKTNEIYFMYNIIDKPEILNTGDYCAEIGEYVRSFRLKDFSEQNFNMSSDLVTDAYAGVSVGDTLVPRSIADTTDTMKWKKTADVSGYGVYLEVISKTLYGSFTYQKGAGTIPGGYVVKVHIVDLV